MLSILPNVHDGTGKFHEALMLQLMTKVQPLLQSIAKVTVGVNLQSAVKEVAEEKLLSIYLNILRTVFNLHKPLAFEQDYLHKVLLQNIIQSVLSLVLASLVAAL